MSELTDAIDYVCASALETTAVSTDALEDT